MLIHQCYEKAAGDDTIDYRHSYDQCYENGGYDTIDYRQPVQPPLDPPDLAWATRGCEPRGCDSGFRCFAALSLIICLKQRLSQFP